MMRDMFGNEVTVTEARAMLAKKGRKPTPKRGYADKPGTGPEGETCKTCRHIYRNQMAKTYLKCGLMRAVWTGGAATDIKASWPACSKWEPAA